MSWWRFLVAAALCLPAIAQAQFPTRPIDTRRPTTTTTTPATPGRPQNGAAGGARDTTGRDTTKRELVKWAEPDSVMQELLARTGYAATRYQGTDVTFQATTRTINLEGKRSAVQREGATLVGDTIVYSDSMQVVDVRGDTVVLRDPAQGPDDVVARHRLTYDVARRRGTVTELATVIEETNQRWVLHGVKTAFQNDSASGRKAFYVRDGDITSCEDPTPHYHFHGREIKAVSKDIMVVRPAVLYIADIPVMWLPFIFQDLRSGRRSGILTPQLGVSELFRGSPSYRRQVERVGYFFNINDYSDASAWIDWRSEARSTTYDPGYLRYNGEWRYRWIDRFVNGELSSSYMQSGNGQRNTSVYWRHSQDFSQRSHLQVGVNFVTNTTLQRQNALTTAQVLGTIRSDANYQQQFGFASLSLGGSRVQYPGLSAVEQDFPTLSIASQGPINIGPHLVWTPTFSLTNNRSLNGVNTGQFANRYFQTASGALDSIKVMRNSRNTSMSFNTPLRIFDFNLSNSFAFNDVLQDFPDTRDVRTYSQSDTGLVETVHRRVFARTFTTGLDWQPSFGLPAFSQGRWNFTPNVSFANVDAGPFWVRTEQSNGAFVHQSKRPVFGASISPTLFGLFPGIGGIKKIRNSITPILSYSYAPSGHISDEYLQAMNQSRLHDLTALRQNAVSLNVSTNVEIKLRAPADSADEESGRKLKILSLGFDPLAYDFERAAELRRRASDSARVGRFAGLTSSTWGYHFSSDLLPGLDAGVTYSLFQGDPTSDTATFSPYRENVRASFSVNRNSSFFVALARIFGRATSVPVDPDAGRNGPPDDNDVLARQVAAQPVAGSSPRTAQFSVPSGDGWRASFTFSSSRMRPPRGNATTVNLASVVCEQYRAIDPYTFGVCTANPNAYINSSALLGSYNSDSTTRGGPIYITPPNTTLQSQMSFNITPKLAASWSTGYDLERHAFAQQQVTLQRQLHDWRAIFAFTQAPNGNFAFNFFIALNAEPDLKFDYRRNTYRREDQY